MWAGMKKALNIKAILKSKRKLRSDILFDSLAILASSIAIIIAYTYLSNTQTTFELSQQYIKQSSKRLNERITRLLHTTESLVNAYVFLLSNKELEKTKSDIDFVNSLQGMMDSNPQISTVYFGTINGFFLEFSSPKTLATYFTISNVKVPENTTIVLKEITNTPVNDKGTLEISDQWYFLIGGKNLSEPLLGERTGYDPRKRGWYIESSKTKELVWSDIYIFTSLLRGESGVTVSRAIYNNEAKMVGVFGADISLNTLSSFLNSTRISENSHYFIINDKNEIVASSILKMHVRLKNSELKVQTVEELGDPILKFAMESRNQKEDALFFNHAGKDYFAFFQEFPHNFQNKWISVSISPVDDFVGKIKENRNRTFLWSLLILFFAFTLTYRLAKRISSPIVTLSEEASKIKDLDLDGKINIESNIHEISDLANAMASLKTTMQSFSYYIPKTLVKQLINRKQSIHVGGRAKELTLMFTDIENFTSVSEEISADRLVVYLSEYFEELTKIIMGAQGTVDKYIGDAIMAFWGAPLNDRHHIYNACHAALLCQKRLTELNRVWKRDGRPVFNTRMGIHMGQVIIGNMGSSERMNYTAIGDNVNLCARLESLNKLYGTNILVSENVYNLVKDHFLFRLIDLVAVKGKSKSVKIYELVAQLKNDNSLLPSDEQIEFCAQFDKAYKLFLTRQWKEALESFNSLTAPNGSDRSIALYVARCKQFIGDPPSKEWDGTIVLTEK